MQCMPLIQYYKLVTIYLAKTLVKMMPDTDIDESESNDVRCVHIVIHMTFFLYKCAYVCVYACVCVGRCLATKVFIGNLLATGRG